MRRRTYTHSLGNERRWERLFDETHLSCLTPHEQIHAGFTRVCGRLDTSQKQNELSAEYG